MPITGDDDVGHMINDEEVEAEERWQSVGVIDAKNEEMHERQQEEGEEGEDAKCEEDTKLLSDDWQVANDSRAQNRKDKGEEEKHFGGQGVFDPVCAEDEKGKFEETEVEVHRMDDGHQSKVQNVSEEVKENAMEGFETSNKLLEGGFGAAEGFGDQEAAPLAPHHGSPNQQEEKVCCGWCVLCRAQPAPHPRAVRGGLLRR